MPLVNAAELVKAAHKGHYCIGAFNTNNLEWTRAILAGAQELNVPVIIQTSMGAAKYMGGYEFCQTMIEAAVKAMDITVPVVIHLDHGNYEAAKEAIAAGYNSVMFDGHDLDFE
ncbi:fructose-bisphosphate aldolase, partial [Vitellibacter sp. q18]|nr:fructose-bisphosphate aldolase [Aequorivita lutea]